MLLTNAWARNVYFLVFVPNFYWIVWGHCYNKKVFASILSNTLHYDIILFWGSFEVIKRKNFIFVLVNIRIYSFANIARELFINVICLKFRNRGNCHVFFDQFAQALDMNIANFAFAVTRLDYWVIKIIVFAKTNMASLTFAWVRFGAIIAYHASIFRKSVCIFNLFLLINNFYRIQWRFCHIKIYLSGFNFITFVYLKFFFYFFELFPIKTRIFYNHNNSAKLDYVTSSNNVSVLCHLFFFGILIFVILSNF